MTNITVANIEWEIVQDVVDALEAARLDGEPVFQTVSVRMSTETARGDGFSGETPIAIVIWEGTTEMDTVESVKHNLVSLNLIVANDIQADTDASRLQEGTRLWNAVRNIIETTPPSDSTAWGSGTDYQQKITWGGLSIQAPTDEEGPPWVVAVIPMTLGYVVENGTSH